MSVQRTRELAERIGRLLVDDAQARGMTLDTATVHVLALAIATGATLSAVAKTFGEPVRVALAIKFVRASQLERVLRGQP